MPLADDLRAAGVAPGTPVAIAVADVGVALAWSSAGDRIVRTDDPATVVGEVAQLDPRWTWWQARETATPLVAAGIRIRSCWDLGAVSRLLHGTGRDDAAATWANANDLPEPATPGSEIDLLALGDDGDEPVRADTGQLRGAWTNGGWADSAERMRAWVQVMRRTRELQEATALALPDPRATPRHARLAVLTAHAESAAAVLAVELGQRGLPVDRPAMAGLLRSRIGERPVDAGHAAAQRRLRDEEVLRWFPPGETVDLRNPAQVRALLARIGFDLPDTRSWRLRPHAEGSPAVQALLAWRKTERLATTYGWSWLDEHVGTDGRLRGGWSAAEGAGRMTAGAGLHNLPGELRPGVRAEPGYVFVRADLGQIEPRVLAAVSGDAELSAATRADDLYAPVAAALSCDRPTAKVAVLAAMYGQTSGAAGAALRDMDRAYPGAMAYLRDAERSGRERRDLRTYGGRLLRLSRVRAPDVDGDADEADRYQPSAYGRFARNAVVQGAAAELFKAWAVTVRAGLPSLGADIVLCLHDELLVHAPGEVADDVAALLQSALDATTGWWAAGSGVRFVADVATGGDWAAAHAG